MRLLFVANAYSAHAARWISQLRDTGWEIHLFDPQNNLIHPEMRKITIHTGWQKREIPSETIIHARWPFTRARHFMERWFPHIWYRFVLTDADKRLADLISRLRPNIIHSMSLRNYSYYVYKAQQRLGGTLPAPWIYSCWGNDFYYWGKNPESNEDLVRINKVASSCDYYFCDCRRDVDLAREFGFRGEVLGLYQGGGGYPIAEMQKLRLTGPASTRRIIALKGLQGRWGRAITALQALERCSDALDGYEIVVYQAHPETREAISSYKDRIAAPITVLPRLHYRKIWELFGKARIAIGVNVVDGVPNAMIESMIMGAFPIQTNPGGATEEWIEDGVNGFLVAHDDVSGIENAIRKALTNDELIDFAADINLDRTSQRIDKLKVQAEVIQIYRQRAQAG